MEIQVSTYIKIRILFQKLFYPIAIPGCKKIKGHDDYVQNAKGFNESIYKYFLNF